MFKTDIKKILDKLAKMGIRNPPAFLAGFVGKTITTVNAWASGRWEPAEDARAELIKRAKESLEFAKWSASGGETIKKK